MTIQHKSFHFQVKAVDDEQGLIEAYGSVFDVVDEGDGYLRDIVRKGAFTRTIKNSKSRINAGKAAFLATMLWSHDPQNHLPIGGWTDLKEDDNGLIGKGQIVLETQLGREVYALIKKKVITQFSIGYDIPEGGSKIDHKSGIRELTEIRLWEISPVVFAMNQEALLVSVKAMEQKSVCGNTSGPIGPRNDSWDGAAAKKWIWGKALDEDGKVKAAVAKKYFLQCEGDATLKGSYSYPFWIDDHISVGGVKAVAGALSGARNADPGSDGAAMRHKVETLYARINKKYPDDPELVPRWKDDGKGSRRPMEKKTFAEHYAEEQCEDLLEDWQDVLVCALTCAVLDAFKIGDQPESDIREALADFNKAVMTWVGQGMEYGLSDYLEEQASDWSPADYLMQYGSESRPDYGYMSRRGHLSRKAGRAISASNAGKISDHVDALHDMADAHMKAMKSHVKALHAAADSMAGMLPASEDGDGKEPDDNQKAASFERTRRPHSRSEASTASEDDVTATLATLQSLFK